ncbi:uncharacterized protein TRIADDRAFT_22566 [Trichoplax adhaerens]|uniref:Vacuolar protein sorting-associated protein 45 n=1 Tax=Trichoplax adhaerens TaxID=10228 RepID=B3RRU0_TRIAD|nr:hypothetical protein TRIADDRAFT_22566 [Trichoplax adhaerens]EDV26408.1 hypothetical protein TRIADDRAFT_22566 [Trichoplax adhaerens]|eukprot:XP_002110404.1 hypothetical protein TRIADDRAFT_22566 [Trichoplax adhaerens]
MNAIIAVKQYITKMVDDCGSGMKVLLMDKETTSIVSMVYAQSEILQKEVYLFESIEQPNRETMKHLKAICFIRPTQDNVELIQQELQSPKYGFYYLYFSNRLGKQALKAIASADEQELVREVQEFYADYFAVNKNLFTLNIPCCYQNMSWKRDKLDRSIEGIAALLLSLKKNPVIRYQQSSDNAKQVAEGLKRLINKEGALFDFRKSDVAPVLIILDRKEDPVTPILNQWTYQAMIHELLTIRKNVVDLSYVPGISKELKQLIFSGEQDEFYDKNLYRNFGEIGQNIKSLMEKFQEKSQRSQKLESIADMKAFVESYPEFKKMSGTVSKHVTVVSELSKIVTEQDLLALSEVEQEISCQTSHSNAVEMINKVLHNEKATDLNLLRIILLYALRYEHHSGNQLHRFLDVLSRRDFPDQYKKAIQAVLQYGGKKSRGSDIFGGNTPLSITKKFFKGLKGVENIYTQHTPLVQDVLDSLVKGKLSDGQYPYATGSPVRDRVQDVIIFIAGGATYEEAYSVQNFCSINQGVRVLLGGTYVHNFKRFVKYYIS